MSSLHEIRWWNKIRRAGFFNQPICASVCGSVSQSVCQSGWVTQYLLLALFSSLSLFLHAHRCPQAGACPCPQKRARHLSPCGCAWQCLSQSVWVNQWVSKSVDDYFSHYLTSLSPIWRVWPWYRQLRSPFAHSTDIQESLRAVSLVTIAELNWVESGAKKKSKKVKKMSVGKWKLRK